MGDLAPQPAGRHDVGLVGLGHFLPAAAGKFEAHPHQAADFLFGVRGRVDGGPVGLAPAAALRLAKIRPAGQLTQDDQIDPTHNVGFEGRGIDQGVVDLDRADVGEELEALAQAEQALLRPDFGLRILARPAHSPEQNRIRGFGLGPGVGGQCLARLFDRADAKQGGVELDRMAIFIGDGPYDAHALGNDFRANVITGEDADSQFHDVC